MLLTEYIPAKARKVIYSTLFTANAVEGVLDGFEVGLVDSKTQGIILGVSTALGFGLAFKKTTDITVVAEGELQ